MGIRSIYLIYRMWKRRGQVTQAYEHNLKTGDVTTITATCRVEVVEPAHPHIQQPRPAALPLKLIQHAS